MNDLNRSSRRFKVKICGVTSARDLAAACRAGADYIGFNFYPPSPRCVTVDQARELRSQMPEGVEAVGVFVNMPNAEIETIARSVGLDGVQFHGDETPDHVHAWPGRSIRALRVNDSFASPDLDPWIGCWGVLFDAPAEQLYGGSGEAWAYPRVRAAVQAAHTRGQRTFLAGGLSPDNVAAAVNVLPDLFAVDVCSGVESKPGQKDHALLARFFDQLR